MNAALRRLANLAKNRTKSSEGVVIRHLNEVCTLTLPTKMNVGLVKILLRCRKVIVVVKELHFPHSGYGIIRLY